MILTRGCGKHGESACFAFVPCLRTGWTVTVWGHSAYCKLRCGNRSDGGGWPVHDSDATRTDSRALVLALGRAGGRCRLGSLDPCSADPQRACAPRQRPCSGRTDPSRGGPRPLALALSGDALHGDAPGFTVVAAIHALGSDPRHSRERRRGRVAVAHGRGLRPDLVRVRAGSRVLGAGAAGVLLHGSALAEWSNHRGARAYGGLACRRIRDALRSARARWTPLARAAGRVVRRRPLARLDVRRDVGRPAPGCDH